jgi:hypothetical protein
MMRRFGTLFVAVALLFSVGCVVTEDGEIWIDPCLGACLEGEACWGGVCETPYSTSCCDEACQYVLCAYDDGSLGCTDTAYDQYNCGGCGVWCDGYCVWGECQPATYTCADIGLDDCLAYCTDTGTDELNCGGCGNECPYGAFCAGSQCYTEAIVCEDYGLLTCPDGCVDSTIDAFNCGECGLECPFGCFNSECV